MRQYNKTKTNRITNLHCRVSANNDHTRNSRNSFWQHQCINICSHDAIFFRVVMITILLLTYATYQSSYLSVLI